MFLCRSSLVLVSVFLLVVVCVSLPHSVCGAPKRKGLSDKDLRELEDQWMEDEVEDADDTPFKWRKDASGHKMPPPPSGPKTEMGFVQLDKSTTRSQADALAAKWTDIMTTGGVASRAYVIEDDKILFVCDVAGIKDMMRVKKFALKQPETMEFEWNQKKYPKPEKPEEDDEDDIYQDPLEALRAGMMPPGMKF